MTDTTFTTFRLIDLGVAGVGYDETMRSSLEVEKKRRAQRVEPIEQKQRLEVAGRKTETGSQSPAGKKQAIPRLLVGFRKEWVAPRAEDVRILTVRDGLVLTPGFKDSQDPATRRVHDRAPKSFSLEW